MRLGTCWNESKWYIKTDNKITVRISITFETKYSIGKIIATSDYSLEDESELVKATSDSTVATKLLIL